MNNNTNNKMQWKSGPGKQNSNTSIKLSQIKA